MRTIALLTLLVLPLPSAAELPCQCRSTQGELFDVGSQACLTVDGRSFMALCAMSQNVTIWRDTGSPCVTG
ncbi:hypothetical protein [Jannaschia aquimarina]|uniref:Uncharacterized protein n=1 Tax=Jannaschia aquimarina TaxID=935700 RepID=A0A0D1DCZ2_9RHOB|nr:hypothetical protein [Jannaschia aquimarina]KIT17833.1 hypothetical protein jaqu_04230 [Jannaschia aquimarina]SNS90452.1 hypothetical protein SAMN05421775_103252 [Jannaschia aquimarina]